MSFDPKEFAAELFLDLPKLDLHGRRSNDIESEIDQFLYQNFSNKILQLEIIYGLGTGALGEAVRDFLKNHPLVEKVVDKGGSCVVILNA